MSGRGSTARSGGSPPTADAPAFVSGNAATIGEAAPACFEMAQVLDAALLVVGPSFLVLAGRDLDIEAATALRPSLAGPVRGSALP